MAPDLRTRVNGSIGRERTHAARGERSLDRPVGQQDLVARRRTRRSGSAGCPGGRSRRMSEWRHVIFLPWTSCAVDPSTRARMRWQARQSHTEARTLPHRDYTRKSQLLKGLGAESGPTGGKSAGQVRGQVPAVSSPSFTPGRLVWPPTAPDRDHKPLGERGLGRRRLSSPRPSLRRQTRPPRTRHPRSPSRPLPWPSSAASPQG